MCGIYKITNSINGKCYIGQSIDIENRWIKHKSSAFNPKSKEYEYPLYRAIRKYAIDNFTLDIVCECEENELDELEEYYISYFHSHFYENGYNLTNGGEGGRLGVKIFQYDFSGNFIGAYNSIRGAERITGIDHSSIGRALNGKNQSAGNFLWTTSLNADVEQMIQDLSPLSRSNGKKENWIVDVYDLEGRFINTYKTAGEASKALGIPRGSINKCINGTLNMTHNMQFVRHGEEPARPCVTNQRRREVLQYTIDGDLVGAYKNVTDVNKLLGFDISSISKCCKGKISSAYGYIWKYVDI